MKIAIAFYGQPRNYKKGYTNVMKFIKKQTDCSFDFFYHVWKLNDNETYASAPWRKIDKNDLVYDNSILDNLKELYNPVSYLIENQSLLIVDISKNTIAYKNTNQCQLNNRKNILYQHYSRNQVRKLIEKHNIQYDFIIMLRFDISDMPQLILTELDKEKTYVSYRNYPRHIIPDNCIISPSDVFLKWFNTYENLNNITDNHELEEIINSLNEKLIVNSEELLLANYLFYFNNINNIKHFEGGNI
jgi:hypothetical protein